MGRVRSHSGAKERKRRTETFLSFSFALSFRCGSALSPLKELTQFEMRPCAVQNKSRPCCIEDDEESEMRAY